jgi:uncharacterized protein YbjT (DUF2867 family)
VNQVPIHVTGGMGRGAVRELLALGHRVRAMVSSLDDRSEALKAFGADPTTLSLHTEATLPDLFESDPSKTGEH